MDEHLKPPFESPRLDFPDLPGSATFTSDESLRLDAIFKIRSYFRTSLQARKYDRIKKRSDLKNKIAGAWGLSLAKVSDTGKSGKKV